MPRSVAGIYLICIGLVILIPVVIWFIAKWSELSTGNKVTGFILLAVGLIAVIVGLLILFTGKKQKSA